MEEFLLRYQVGIRPHQHLTRPQLAGTLLNQLTVCKLLIPLLCVCVQDLLHLQYEGIAVMKMFDKAKVNVNLLIFLLNKKLLKK